MTQTAGLAVEIQDRTRSGAIAAGKSFKKIERGAKGAGRAVGGMEKSMRSLAKVAVGGMGLAMVAQELKQAVKASIEFSKSMAEVSTLISGDITSKMAELTLATEGMSTAFGQDVNTEAKALYGIISAGANAGAEATNILMVANKLAVGGVTDVATAADGLTSTLNAYGLSAGDAMSVSDDLFAAMKAGKTTIGELAQGMSLVAPIASQTGVSLEEVLAATAALTLTGEPTQRAMRGLAQVIASTLKPTSEARAMTEELRETYEDFEFSAAALKRLGLADFLDTIKEATGGSSEKMAQLFGGVEALKPILALTGIQAEKFREIFEKMSGNVGDTTEAFDKMAKTEFFKMAKLEQSFASMQRGVGMGLLNILERPIQSVNEDMKIFNGLVASGMEKFAAFVAMFSFATLKGSLLQMVEFEKSIDNIRRDFGLMTRKQWELHRAQRQQGSLGDDFAARTQGMFTVDNIPMKMRKTSTANPVPVEIVKGLPAVPRPGGGGLLMEDPFGIFDLRPDPADLPFSGGDPNLFAKGMELNQELWEGGVANHARVMDQEDRLAQRRADNTGEYESMVVRQGQEVIRWQGLIGSGDTDRMKLLTSIHQVEKDSLETAIKKDVVEQTAAEKAIAAQVVAQKIFEFQQAIDMFLTVLDRTGHGSGLLMDLGIGLQQLLTPGQGLSGGANMFFTLGDAAWNAQRKTLVYVQSLRDVQAVTAKAVADFNQLTIAIGGPFASELNALQTEAVEPLLQQFRNMRGQADVGESMLDTFRLFSDALTQARDLGGGLGEIIPETLLDVMGPVGTKFLRDIGEGFLDEETARDMSNSIFGPILEIFGDMELDQFIREMFALDVSMQDFGNEIDGLGDRLDEAGERARRLRFTGEEISARTQAAEQFRLAGSDIFLQKAALEELSDTIASIQAAERLSIAAVAAASRTGTGTGAGDTSAGTGDVSDAVDIDQDSRLDIDLTDRIDFDPFVVTDYEDIIDVSSAAKIQKDWSDAVQFTTSHLVRGFGITDFNQVIEWGGSVTKHSRPWHHAVGFTPSNLVSGFGVSHFDRVVEWSGSVTKHPVPWAHAVEFTASDLVGGFGVDHFNKIVSLGSSHSGPPMAGISKLNPIPWDGVLSFTASLVGGFGVADWKDVISETSVSDLTTIKRDWTQAIELTGKYGDHSQHVNFESWNDVISETAVSGLTKIEKNWDDAISFSPAMISDWSSMISTAEYTTRANINMGRVIRFYGASAALNKAMRGVKAQVDVELSFNTSSEIREQIEAIVSDAMLDGRISSSTAASWH